MRYPPHFLSMFSITAFMISVGPLPFADGHLFRVIIPMAKLTFAPGGMATGPKSDCATLYQALVGLVLADSHVPWTVICSLSVKVVDDAGKGQSLSEDRFNNQILFRHITIVVCPWVVWSLNHNISL